jgi:hypothetical protein
MLQSGEKTFANYNVRNKMPEAISQVYRTPFKGKNWFSE